jgi:hypothetical protein
MLLVVEMVVLVLLEVLVDQVVVVQAVEEVDIPMGQLQ